MHDELFEESRAAGGTHNALQHMCGTWSGEARTWFEPGVLANVSPIRGMIRPVLQSRFVLHEYEGTLKDEPMHGVALMGYDLRERRWQVAWADTAHMGTGILFSQTRAEPEKGPFSVLGSYGDGQGGPPWGWRTEVHLSRREHLVITHFNITPGGEEAKAVEIDYHRTG
ncbi:MAG: DUF1579 domain-containing protein [Planctomycetota bacterium]|jgi:hypothetical protein